MLIATGTIFKFYTTEIWFFSNDLTNDNSRHSDDDKDCSKGSIEGETRIGGYDINRQKLIESLDSKAAAWFAHQM